MSPGALLYRLATRGLAPFLPVLLHHRIRTGKEDASRRNERFARHLASRPEGRLVWMHGASVGESQLLIGLAELMAERRKGLSFLFTSQTQTSAQLVSSRAPVGALHQMAPIDTPGAAKRFVGHWRPDLAIFAEGEIWPNLIAELSRTNRPLALVNARMTERSRKGWAKWPGFSKRLFGAFDLILPADKETGQALTELSGKPVADVSNLKRGLPPPPVDRQEQEALEHGFLAGRACLVAASTHPGEEALFLDAASHLNDEVALIIAPRHPERGPEIAAELSRRGLEFARRSAGDRAERDHDALLADTIGEMGLWYRLSDLVFLGGASVEGIGGHNPIEPLQLERAVITGPHGFNFQSLFRELSDTGLLNVVDGEVALSKAFIHGLKGETPIDGTALKAFLAKSEEPLRNASESLLKLLDTGRAR
ncbi:MAG: glycosyltransferase N-terminal domain-containing protein [Pseudomonadota bacterium]